MFRKCFCLILALCLLMGCTAYADTTVAIEETSPFFDLTISLPDGCTLSQEMAEETTVATLTLPAADAIAYTLTVAFSDLYTGKDMSSLSDAEVEELFHTAVNYQEGDSITYTVKDFADGVRALIIYDPGVNFMAWALTILDGYFIQVYGMYSDFREVTREDVEFCVSLLDRIEATPVQ